MFETRSQLPNLWFLSPTQGALGEFLFHTFTLVYCATKSVRCLKKAGKNVLVRRILTVFPLEGPGPAARFVTPLSLRGVRNSIASVRVGLHLPGYDSNETQVPSSY